MNSPRFIYRGFVAMAVILMSRLGQVGAALAVRLGYLPLPVRCQPTTPAALNTPAGGGVFLVGAGDIAECGLPGDRLTANLLAQFPTATLFTAGDNTYESGSPLQFKNCFNPTYGRYKARIHPRTGQAAQRLGQRRLPP